MKGKLIIVTILVFIFLAFAGVKYFILDKQNQFGRIKIVSSPSASVFLDNVASGRTPYEAQVKVGDLVLKLIPNGEATATASWQGKVKIYRNTLTYVNRELGSSDLTSAGEILTAVPMEKKPSRPDTGEVYIETEPVGAIINLNNEEKGIAPLLLADVPKGQHEVSVYMPGFFRRTQKINVETGYRVNIIFKLAIDQNSPIHTQKDKKEASGSAETVNKTFVKIKETPTGFLRVRSEPSVSASESAQVKPGARFEMLEESGDWYKIRFEENKEGWIFSQYADKESN